jgi:hypothetical protein
MPESKDYVSSLSRSDLKTAKALNAGWPYANYSMTIFSTKEEKITEGSQLGGRMLFYPEEALKLAGAKVKTAELWTSHVVVDRELITGQNPASDDALINAFLQALSKKEHKTAEAGSQVIAVGDLRKIDSNLLSGDAALKPKLGEKGVYGLGMLNGLKGELLIWDSVLHYGSFENNQYRTAILDDATLAFGFYTQPIKNWTPMRIPEKVISFKDLEVYIGNVIQRNAYDESSLIPFRLDLEVNRLKWFVVNGMGNQTPTPRESFLRQRYLGGLDDIAIDAFGIYSKNHRGIYTNANSNLHIHFKTKSEDIFIGHLDDELTFKPGGILYLAAP